MSSTFRNSARPVIGAETQTPGNQTSYPVKPADPIEWDAIFDRLTWAELDTLWDALYAKEQATLGTEVAEKSRALIEQLYRAKNWPGVYERASERGYRY